MKIKNWQRILNETNSIYMKQNIDKYALEARNSIAFLDTSIEKIRKLALSSEKLNKFKKNRFHMIYPLKQKISYQNLSRSKMNYQK